MVLKSPALDEILAAVVDRFRIDLVQQDRAAELIDREVADMGGVAKRVGEVALDRVTPEGSCRGILHGQGPLTALQQADSGSFRMSLR
jgi:hypothetical protein